MASDWRRRARLVTQNPFYQAGLLSVVSAAAALVLWPFTSEDQMTEMRFFAGFGGMFVYAIINPLCWIFADKWPWIAYGAASVAGGLIVMVAAVSMAPEDLGPGAMGYMFPMLMFLGIAPLCGFIALVRRGWRARSQGTAKIIGNDR